MRAFGIGLLLLIEACTYTVTDTSPDDPPGTRERAPDPLRDVVEEFTAGHYRTVHRLLDTASGPATRDAHAQYLEGYAWVRLHRPDLGKRLLQLAAEGGFDGYPGWESTATLLERIAVVEQLRPPLSGSVKDARGVEAVRVFADDTPWIQAIVQALPEFMVRAHAVLGEDLPPIDFYLFRSRDSYNRFYKALFGVPIVRWWQNGTGDSNVVAFCQEDREGKSLGPPGLARARGDVLHEYTHALLNGLYGDGYLRQVPQWLDEGLSDFTARPYYKELFEASGGLIRKALAKSTPPTSLELSHGIYEHDSSLRYAMARVMVEELMRGREMKVIPEILRHAAAGGDFESSILAVTGISSSQLRERVIARYR